MFQFQISVKGKESLLETPIQKHMLVISGDISDVSIVKS